MKKLSLFLALVLLLALAVSPALAAGKSDVQPKCNGSNKDFPAPLAFEYTEELGAKLNWVYTVPSKTNVVSFSVDAWGLDPAIQYVVTWSVNGGEDVESGPMFPNADGTLDFSFGSSEDGPYTVSYTVSVDGGDDILSWSGTVGEDESTNTGACLWVADESIVDPV